MSLRYDHRETEIILKAGGGTAVIRANTDPDRGVVLEEFEVSIGQWDGSFTFQDTTGALVSGPHYCSAENPVRGPVRVMKATPKATGLQVVFVTPGAAAGTMRVITSVGVVATNTVTMP